MRLQFFLIPVVIFYSIALHAQVDASHYLIYSVKEQKVVGVQDIVNAMENHDVLFFGEEHNDSVGHYLEHTILEAMFNQYKTQITLSMEMFDRDVQPVMDEYLQGSIREKQFIKDARVWSNYKDYKPMVEFAKANHLQVVCANAAGRYSSLAVRGGMKALIALPEASKKFMAPLPYDTASGKYHDKLVEVFNQDMGGAPPMLGFNMVMGQSLWDATMAYSIASYLKKHKTQKVMQVNGRFHSDEGFAVVTQLKNYRPKSNPLIISSGSDDTFPNIDWNQFKTQGDFIIITDPKVPKTFEE